MKHVRSAPQYVLRAAGVPHRNELRGGTAYGTQRGTFLVQPRVERRSVLRQERNRSERAKISNAAEWKPPAPTRASRRWGTPAVGKTGGTSIEAHHH